MTSLLLVRERLRQFYGRYELFITPGLKFLLALLVYTLINQNIGYMDRITNPLLVLMVSLINSILPVNAILVLAAVFTLLHLYELSLICSAVVLLLFLLLFFLYFRFSPKDGIAVLLTPIAFTLNIPYAVPLCLGLKGNLFSVVSVSCGVIVYYTIEFVKANNATITDMELEAIVREIRGVLDGILNNTTMRVMAVSFAITVLIVFLIRRMSFDHSWTVAIGAGALCNVMIILICDLSYDLNVSIPSVLLGSIFSFLIALIMEFFLFSVDYSRTEFLEFEDDEYYYYVKAIPKLSVAVPEKTVKKIVEAAPPPPPIPASFDRKGRSISRDTLGKTGESPGKKNTTAGSGVRKGGPADTSIKKIAASAAPQRRSLPPLNAARTGNADSSRTPDKRSPSASQTRTTINRDSTKTGNSRTAFSRTGEAPARRTTQTNTTSSSGRNRDSIDRGGSASTGRRF